jgi:hypothetical protein
MKNILNFEKIVGLSAFFIAGCAAYFSILGIGMLFSGSYIAAMTMASSLELGKLVGTSFLYRYWDNTKIFLRAYLIIAVVVLMIITSLGIFGYLSSAYQSSSIENKLIEDKIAVVENQKKYSQDKIDESKKRITNITTIRNSQEQRLSESLTNKLIARNPIELENLQQQTQESISQSQKDMETENNKIQKSIDELQQFDKQISDMKLKNGNKKDILTFKFVADAMHMNLDVVVKWFIVVLISVFDPLAVCLLLAYNTSTFTKKESIEDIIEEAKNELPVIKSVKPTETTQDIKSVETVMPPIEVPVSNPVDPIANPVIKSKPSVRSRSAGLFHF